MKPALWLIPVVCLACELTEVAQPNGEKVVVVQGVMRPDLPQQWVLVEETLTGADPRQSTPGDLPPDRPQLPVVGAQVVVDNLTFPGDPCGHPVIFTREPVTAGLFDVDGVYWAPPGCPTLRPGDSLAIRVETPDGVMVTGDTEVVGATRFALITAGDSIVMPDSIFTFNRDRDTIVARVTSVAGRSVQVDFRRADIFKGLDGTTKRVTSLFVDSTVVTLPGTLSDVYSRNTGDFVFRPGRQYDLTVSLADDNYFDFVRSSNGPITGRGFINHLDGGIGVFGSVVAATTPVRVVGDQDDVREGVYRIRGDIAGIPVDTEWDVYLLRPTRDSVSASAFVAGRWLFGPLSGTAGLAEGFFVGDEFEFFIQQEERDPDFPELLIVHPFRIRGAFQPGSFTVRVFSGALPIGTLAATR